MPTVGELIHSVRKDAVLASLALTYEGDGEDPEGYSEAWDTLLNMQPKPTTLSCLLSFLSAPGLSAGGCVDVSGIEPNDPQHYAIEFVEWAQWLSMPVIVSDELGDMSPVEQLAHVFYELTWGGYSQDSQQAQREIIDDRYEEVKDMLKGGADDEA